MKTITASEFVVMWEYSQTMAIRERDALRRLAWQALDSDTRVAMREIASEIADMRLS